MLAATLALAAAATHAATDLAAWRTEAAAARLLAENDLPRAMAEAQRLQRALPPDAPAPDRARVLNLLSRIETYQALTEDAARHARQAHTLAVASGDKIGQAEADLNVALNSINQGRLDELVQATNEAVSILEGVDRPDLLGEAMLRATVMYRRFEQFEESVSVAVQAMEIARRSGHPLALAYAHQGLAISYDQSFKAKESLQHYQQMGEQARIAGSRMLHAFALQGVTGQAVRDKDYATAERTGREVLKMFREIGAPFAQAFGHFGLADILRQAGRPADALPELDQAFAIYERYPNRIGLWFVLNARSAVYQALKNFAAAQADAERGNEIARGLGFAIYTATSAIRLAEVMAARGDHARAYALATEARELSGQAARERVGRRVVELTQRYQTESKQRQIEELTRRNEQQTGELRQRELQERWLWTLQIASALVLALIAFFLLRMRRSHRMLRDLNTELAASRDAVRELNTGLEQRIEARTAQLRQQARYLRTLIDMLPLWAWFKDTGNRYLVTNQAFARARGCGVEHMVGKSDLELLPAPLALASQQEDDRVQATRERRVTEMTADEAGHQVWMECFKAPVLDDDGTLLGTVGVARDISAQKATEAAREAALQEAQRLAQARSAFLAQMSHELRTPLNAILGFAQVLQHHAPLDERQARSLTIIQHSGQHLLALINDVLDLARVDAGKLELTPRDVTLQPFLELVADIARVKAEEKRLQFAFSPSPGLPDAVVVDDMRLRQVLLNLLANAVKFTDAGQVSLRVRPMDAEGGGQQARLRFEVADSGVGMNPEQVARLFQPFEQVGEARRRTGGTGLGLAISAELLRLMGGELAVRSQPGQGSVFWFDLVLPVAAGHVAHVPAAGEIVGYEGPRRRVLVVDDSEPLRTLMAESLGAAGFEVACAADGREGIERAHEFAPDLMLIDMSMPVLGGLDAVRVLRGMRAFADVPVVMTSASERAETQGASAAAGAQAYVPKPIDSQQLLQTVGRLLGLNWIRAGQSQTGGPRPVAPAGDTTGVALAPQELQALRHAASSGSMRAVHERADHLQALDPAYESFARRLRELADNYQSQAIVALVDACSVGP
jgi:PAS domain S-box-containing protein